MKNSFKNFLLISISVAVTLGILAYIYNFVPIKYLGIEKSLTLGSTITSIALTDTVRSALYATTNNNFTNLNNDKLEANSYTSQLTVASTTIGVLNLGYFNATSTTATSTMLAGLSLTRLSATATSTMSGLQLSGGCILYNGSCLTNAVTDVTNSDSTLTISPTTGNVVASLNLGNSNVWTALQAFSYTATTTFAGDINSGGLIGANYFNATSTTATSTFRGGTKMDYATTTNLTVSGTCTNCATNGYEIKTGTCTLNGASPSVCSATVSCTTGKVAISGGSDGASGLGAGVVLKMDSYPTGNPATGWTLDVGGPNSATDAFTAYAICVNP